jgi:hypothetical protein
LQAIHHLLTYHVLSWFKMQNDYLALEPYFVLFWQLDFSKWWILRKLDNINSKKTCGSKNSQLLNDLWKANRFLQGLIF